MRQVALLGVGDEAGRVLLRQTVKGWSARRRNRF